jgi:hypothetical protein
VIFMEDRPQNNSELEVEAAYQRMSQDKAREIEALEWAEALVGDVGDEKD